MKPRYVMFAAYNRWANECVYTAAAALSDADYRRDCAAFFCSVHGTLNHMLVADRVWMRRFTGEGVAPAALDTILHDDFAPLRADRIKEDERIVRWIDSLDDARLASDFDYMTITNPSRIAQPLHFALDHFFNHQTHHRGQLHCLLTQIAGKAAGPVLDLIAFQRQAGLGGARKVG
jgi:uncharacterized damage-inducible protein DinB